MSGPGNKKSGTDKATERLIDKSTAEKIAAAGLRAHGEMLACDIPVELPIIPLASTVVFPQMVVNLQVVRNKKLTLLRDMDPESIIGLVVQKSSSIDVPPIEELSAVGVAARLVNKINVSGNTIQIILLGLSRYRVAGYIQTEPYLTARVACIDEKEEESMEANMLMGNALHLLENLIQLEPRVPGEILNLIKNNLSGPGNLADQVANHLNFELEEKKEILTTIDPMGRLKVAVRLIEKAIGLAKAGQEIKEQTEDEIRKAQREFFLREQLKVIKKELGEESETAATVREAREKIEKAGLPEEARKEAEIRGHRRTYVGAMPGKIIQSLRRAGSRNPLFMIDEVDKIGMDFRGDPASALLEVLDPEQNNSFTDLYLDLAFDLSRVMFITTANRLDTIPDPLRDRMEILHLPGYVEEEKLDIARQFLIPRQITEHGLTKDLLGITEDALKEIIRGYTSDSGLRKLEQQIATICRKVAKEIASGRPKGRAVDVRDLQEFLGPIVFIPEMAERTDEIGVSTGLAWTSAGGDIL